VAGGGDTNFGNRKLVQRQTIQRLREGVPFWLPGLLDPGELAAFRTDPNRFRYAGIGVVLCVVPCEKPGEYPAVASLERRHLVESVIVPQYPEWRNAKKDEGIRDLPCKIQEFGSAALRPPILNMQLVSFDQGPPPEELRSQAAAFFGDTTVLPIFITPFDRKL